MMLDAICISKGNLKITTWAELWFEGEELDTTITLRMALQTSH